MCWRSRAASQFDLDWDRRFIAKIKLVAKIKVITHPRAKFARASRGPSEALAAPMLPIPQQPYQCVVVGASTGGPGAVLELLCAWGPISRCPFSW